MKRLLTYYISIAFCFFCLCQCTKRDEYAPQSFLPKIKQDTIIYNSIRYSAKLAPRSNHQTKFKREFDNYYRSVAADYSFMYLYKIDENDFNFLIQRPAKSITPLFEGIAGRLKLDKNDSIVFYEEIFRTWKMPYKDLQERGRLLFDRLVTNRDLTLFYSKYTGDKYIEFPDDRFHFDKSQRVWKDNAYDSMNQSK
jgi:hypothetical protein